MKNLLKANFHKLFRSKVFWLIFIAMPCVNIYAAVTCSDWLIPHEIEYGKGQLDYTGWSLSYKFTYLGHMDFFAYAVIVMAALFIGDELSSGAIRNKIMAGHSRTKLFLSYFITTYAGMLLVHIVSELVGLGFCLLRYGTGLYRNIGKYTPDITGKDVLEDQLHDMIYLNIMPVVAIAGTVALTILLMMAVGRRAPGFVAAIILDIVSCLYVEDKLYTINTLYDGTRDSLTSTVKSDLFLLCCDPNGLTSCTMEYFFDDPLSITLFPVCAACCGLTAVILIAAGMIVTNKRDLK